MADRPGLPLASLLTPANLLDSAVFGDLIDAIPPIERPNGRRRKRPSKLHADKAYDIPRCRRALTTRHIKVRIAARASIPARGWGGIAGSSNARSPGCPACAA